MQGDSMAVKIRRSGSFASHVGQTAAGCKAQTGPANAPAASRRIVRDRVNGYSGGAIQDHDMTVSPLDDFRALLAALPPLDDVARDAALAQFVNSGIAGSRLAAIAAQVAATAGRKPSVSRPQLALFAGAHGVARLGVSDRRIDATMSAVAAFGSGDAPASHLCAANMVGLKVYDLALHLPTGDISRQPAMDERSCAATLAFGMEAIAGGPDLVIVSAVRSAGDDVVAHALLGALFANLPADAGLSQQGALAVADALKRHAGGASDALSALADLGGREIAACVGAIVAARSEKLPVILDGLTALTAAAVVHALNADAVGHCMIAEVDGAVSKLVVARLGLTQLLGGGYEAGEGTAGVVAVGLVKDALSLQAGLSAHARATAH